MQESSLHNGNLTETSSLPGQGEVSRRSRDGGVVMSILSRPFTQEGLTKQVFSVKTVPFQNKSFNKLLYMDFQKINNIVYNRKYIATKIYSNQIYGVKA